jgi:hypothetical protein
MISNTTRLCFSPVEMTLNIHYAGGRAGLKSWLDTEVTGKVLSSVGDRTPVVQSAVRHYTELPQILVQIVILKKLTPTKEQATV